MVKETRVKVWIQSGPNTAVKTSGKHAIFNYYCLMKKEMRRMCAIH